MLKSLFKKPEREAAQALYATIVEQVHHPAFYTDLEVPDTFEGRFELVALHTLLVLRKLQPEAPIPQSLPDPSSDDAMKPPAATATTNNQDRLARFLLEAMFDNMDVSLREMGVGDLSVGKKIRHVAEAFFGRSRAYMQCLEDASDHDFDKMYDRNPGASGALVEALSRNVYARVEGESLHPSATRLTLYVLDVVRVLDAQPFSRLCKGIIDLPDPARQIPEKRPNEVSA